MSKSRARFLAELLNSSGLVIESKSSLAGADGIVDLDNLPTITNAKLENSSISIAGHSTALGGSVSLDTADISEHTDYPYFTNARARGAVSVSGSLSYDSSTGVISYTQPTNISTFTNDSGYLTSHQSLTAYATLASPTFTGTPAAPTATAGTNTTQIATTAFVTTAVDNIVDAAPGTLNTLNELAAALGDDANFSTTVTNSIATKLPLAGGTLTGNLNFGDDDKAIFGAGSDLTIEHNGTFSRIQENGTGPLYIQATDLYLTDSGGVDVYATFTANGAATLRYDNSQKLATTSTGIDVTGTAVTDGLTVDASTAVVQASNAGGTTSFEISNTNGVSTANNKAALYLSATGAEANAARIESDFTGTVATNHAQDLKFYYVGSGSAPVLGQKIANNGDISFYNSAGTSQDLYWDASTSRLGLGTTSPDANLEVIGSYKQKALDANAQGFTLTVDSSTDVVDLTNYYNAAMTFGTNNTERMRIDSSGRVGIGTSSPSNNDYGSIAPKLHVLGTSSTGAYNLVARFQAGNDSNDTGASILINHSNDRGLLIEAGRQTGDVGVAYFNILSSGGSKSQVMSLLQSGAITFNQAYTFPTSDGSANQVLQTDGSGNLSFATVSGGGGSSTSLSDADGDTKIQVEETSDEDAIRFDTAGSQRMIITSGGNVGIGTSSTAQASLDINVANRLGNSFTGTTDGEGISVNQTNYTSGNYVSLIEGAYQSSTRVPNVRIGAKFTGSGSSLLFGTSNGYSSGITNTALEIDYSGNASFAGTISSGAITATGTSTFDDLKADNGNLVLGDDAFSTNSSYVGMKTSYQSGVNDYMIISGTGDGNTYISAASGTSVYIRGGGNSSTYEIRVPGSTTPTVGSNVIWHAGNDGSGSGLDADTLDGQNGSYYTSRITVNALGSSDDLNSLGTDYGWYRWSSTANSPSNSPDDYAVMLYLNDGGQPQQLVQAYGGSAPGVRLYGRRKTSGTWDTTWTEYWSTYNDGSGSGLDADTLDGVQGSSYLRSDTADTFTGTLTLNGSLQMSGTTGSDIHLPRSGWITFYGNSNANHAIGSRDLAGAESDDIRINSYGAVILNLDANNNDTSTNHSSFIIGRHGGASGSVSSELFRVAGESGDVYFSRGSGQTNRYISAPSGTYGSIQINGSGQNGWEGYNIDGRAVFMHDGGTSTGLFNDVNDHWLFLAEHGGASKMYHAGSPVIQTTSSTAAEITGDLQVKGHLEVDSGNNNKGFVLSSDGSANSASVGVTTSNRVGMFWHNSTTDYTIHKTIGTWSSPNYQQLKLDWDTGIYLDGGTAYGLSGVRVLGNNNSLIVNGNTVWNAGNDGSGSGLDADLLDGIQLAALQQAYARNQGWNPTYSNSDEASVYYDFTERAVVIDGANDNALGAAYKAIPVTSGETVKFNVQIKGSVADTDGLYVRLYYYSGNLPDGKTHVSHSASHTLVQEDTSGDTSWVENGAISTSYVSFTREWKAPSTGYVSLVILNWSGYGTNKLFVKDVSVEKIQNLEQSSRNIVLRTGSTGAAGLLLEGSNDTYRLQLYSDGGSAYGFLDAEWGGWDIKKTVNGAFQVDEGSGLYRVWNAGNDGSGSGLDADTLDGLNSTSFARVDAASSYTNYAHIQRFYSNSALNTTSSSQSSLEVYNGTAGNDAFMTFHVGGDYALYFGLDGGTNDLAVGGWSKGANSYKVWHAGNDGSGSGLDADTLDGYQLSAIKTNSATDSNQVYIRNNSPTIYLRDTDHISSMIHQNSDRFYILRADAADDTSWTAHAAGAANNAAGRWPLEMNISDSGNYVSFASSNLSAGGYSVWHAGNDGSGSGLDADTLDGYHSAETGASVNLRTSSSGYLILDNWIRTGNSTGLYTADSAYFYRLGAYWGSRGNSSSVTGTQYQTVDGGTRGYVYATNANEIGFLNSAGSWRVRVRSNEIRNYLKVTSEGGFRNNNTTTTGSSKTLTFGECCTVTTGGLTITLPASPSTGDQVQISVGNFTNTTVGRNGQNIMGLAENMTIDVANMGITLVYSGNSTQGWRLI